MANEATVKFLGTTDEHTVCDCCGRKDLKSTVALSIDEGDAVFYGVTCAARALKTSAKEVRAGTLAADRAKEAARVAAERAAWEAGRPAREAWFAWLAVNGKGLSAFEQAQSLGGMAVAKALFAASQG